MPTGWHLQITALTLERPQDPLFGSAPVAEGKLQVSGAVSFVWVPGLSPNVLCTFLVMLILTKTSKQDFTARHILNTLHVLTQLDFIRDLL